MKIKKKKHPFAVLFMTAAIIGAVPLGINSSLSELREEVTGSYYYDQGGYAIYEGLEKRQAAASGLVTLAKRYTDKEPSLESLADELEYQVHCAEMVDFEDKDRGFFDTVRANQNLDAPAQKLAETLEQVDLAEKDKKYPGQLIAQMKSEQDKIQRSSYNEDARDYNAKLERFQPIALQKSLATFDKAVTEEAVVTEDTGIPSPPDAPEVPEAPEAPDYDAVMEQVEDFAGDVVDWAEDFAGDMTDWAEDISDEIADRVTR